MARAEHHLLRRRGLQQPATASSQSIPIAVPPEIWRRSGCWRLCSCPICCGAVCRHLNAAPHDFHTAALQCRGMLQHCDSSLLGKRCACPNTTGGLCPLGHSCERPSSFAIRASLELCLFKEKAKHQLSLRHWSRSRLHLQGLGLKGRGWRMSRPVDCNDSTRQVSNRCRSSCAASWS